MSGFATGLRPFSRGSAAGESDPDTYLLTFAAADTAVANVAASGSIVNTGTGSVAWSITPPSGVTVTPSSGLSIAGTTTSLSIVATAAATYSLSVTAAGATITGNSQSIVVSSSTPTTATLSGSSTATATVAETYTVTLNAAADQTYTITPSASDSATLSASTVTITAGDTAGTFTATWPASGSGRTVDFTISPTLTRAGRPLTVGVSVLTVGAQVATLSVYNESGSGSRPYTATVLPLIGDVPSGSYLSNAAGTEVGDILSAHDDGSAAVVVFASTATGTGTVALHVATGTPHAVLTAAAIAAAGLTSVAVAFGSPYGTASITDFSTPERVWWATSKVYCARYRVAAPTPGSTALEAVIDIHAWADRALVEVRVENAKVDASGTASVPTAASYTAAVVSVNGDVVGSPVNGNGNPTGSHSGLRGWYRSAWVGAGATGLRVTQLHTELQAHPLLFKCATANTADLSIYATDAYTPWSTGRQRASNMGAGGDHASIGPLPQWETRALQSGDSRAWNATEVSALALLGYTINYRDTTTGLVPTFAQVGARDQLTLGGWPGANYNGSMGAEPNHQPAAGLMAFIARPSPVYIEIAQTLCLWAGTISQTRDGLPGGAVGAGVYGPGFQIRGKGWGFRNLVHATFLSPDGSAWRTSGKVTMAANVAHFDGWRTDSKATLGAVWHNDPAQLAAQYTLGRAHAPLWQYHFWIPEMHKAHSVGLLTGSDQTALGTLTDWMCSQPVRWINEQTNGGWRYMPYVTPLGKRADPAVTSGSYITTWTTSSTWDEQMDDWMTDSPPSASGTWMRTGSETVALYSDYLASENNGLGYAEQFWTAFVAAVERGVSGASAAWNTVQSGVTNLSTWLAGFGSEPRHGSYPRTGIAPAWVAGISTSQWTEISSSPVFSTAIDALTPTHTNAQYRPGRAAAIGAIRDAYCDWEFDPITNTFHIFGGGHLDGSNNGVFSFDAAALTYSMPIAPTLVYPTTYTVANATTVYPSGYDTAYSFADATKITANSSNAAIDLPYAAATSAPISSHTYGSMVYSGGKMRRFYSANVAANLSTGEWEDIGVDSIGPQIPTAGTTWQPGSGYNSNSLAESTLAVLDHTRDSIWTTLVNGPITGDSWRGGLLKIDPATLDILRLVNLGGTMDANCSLVIAEPYLYVLRPASNTLATGWRIHLDTYAVEWLTFSGSLPTTITEHVLPAYFDGTKLRVWPYRTDKDALFDINLTPTSGAGTSGSPCAMTVTRTALTASSIPTPEETYRLHYLSDWGVLMVHPSSSSKWWALRTAA